MPRPNEPHSRRAPLALAAAAFASGIWLAPFIERSSAVWGWTSALLALCAIAAVLAKSVRLASVSAAFALICAGAFARVATPTPRTLVPPAEFLETAKVEIIGHVSNDGVLTANQSRERFDLQTELILLNGVKFDRPLGIRATVFSREANEENDAGETPVFPPLNYGDRVRLKAKLRLPRNFHNPGAFDYEGYLHGIGISVLASVKVEDIELLPDRSGSRLGFWRSRIRHSILAHMRDGRLWSREDAALFAAMILGDDSMLLRNVREEFQMTGVYHLLVVSGMNVALLAFAVFWLARRLRCPDWAASAITIGLSIFYAYIAGMGVPIQRAVLMLSLFLIARLLYRDRSSLNATGFALLAISGISLPVLERTLTPYRSALRHLDSASFDLALPPKLAQFRLDLRLVAGRLQRFVGARTARLLI